MNRIKNIAEGIKGILDHVLFMHQAPSGIITMKAKDAQYFISKMKDLQQDAEELVKIQNYTSASTASDKKEEPYKEMVSHPDHYQGSKIECIEAMLDVFGKEKVSAFCELNAFKYQWRANKKGTDLQDKKKAIWYLDKYVELNKKEQ